MISKFHGKWEWTQMKCPNFCMSRTNRLQTQKTQEKTINWRKLVANKEGNFTWLPGSQTITRKWFSVFVFDWKLSDRLDCPKRSNQFSIPFAPIEQSRTACVRRSAQLKYVNKGDRVNKINADTCGNHDSMQKSARVQYSGSSLAIEESPTESKKRHFLYENDIAEELWTIVGGAGHRHIVISFRCNRLDKNM